MQIVAPFYTKDWLRTKAGVEWNISEHIYTKVNKKLKRLSPAERAEKMVLDLLEDEDVGGVVELVDEKWQGRIMHEWRLNCRSAGGIKGRKGQLVVMGLLSEVVLKIKADIDQRRDRSRPKLGPISAYQVLHDKRTGKRNGRN